MRTHNKLFLAVSALFLTACGGGGGGDTYGSTGDSVLISPDTANIAVGQSIPLRITGGIGPYTFTSSNPAILPVPNKIDNLHAADLTLTTGLAYKTEVIKITAIDSKGKTSFASYTVNPTALAVSPSTLNLSSTKTQNITIIGGRPPFTITSSNPEILSVDATNSATQKTFTVLANRTSTRIDNIDVSIVDANGTTVSSKVSVIPFDVFTSILVTPSSTSGTAGPITAGQTGNVTIKVNDTYAVPRALTLTNLLGDFSFVNANQNGGIELTVDSNGTIIAPLTTKAGATTQTGKFRVTDNQTGKYVDSSIQIAGISLSASPDRFSATASTSTNCFTGQVGALQITGGTPPYTILSESPSVLTATPSTISQNGGATILTATGVCPNAVGMNLSITDATGTKTLVPYLSTPAPKVETPLVVALQILPTSLTGIAGDKMNAIIAGGTPPYTATVSNAKIATIAAITGNTIAITNKAIGNTQILISDSLNMII